MSEQNGSIAGYVDLEVKNLIVVFAPGGTENRYNGDAPIGDDGMITPGEGAMKIDGTMDLDSCEASGNLTLGQQYMGTWELSPYNAAF